MRAFCRKFQMRSTKVNAKNRENVVLYWRNNRGPKNMIFFNNTSFQELKMMSLDYMESSALFRVCRSVSGGLQQAAILVLCSRSDEQSIRYQTSQDWLRN